MNNNFRVGPLKGKDRALLVRQVMMALDDPFTVTVLDPVVESPAASAAFRSGQFPLILGLLALAAGVWLA